MRNGPLIIGIIIAIAIGTFFYVQKKPSSMNKTPCKLSQEAHEDCVS